MAMPSLHDREDLELEPQEGGEVLAFFNPSGDESVAEFDGWLRSLDDYEFLGLDHDGPSVAFRLKVKPHVLKDDQTRDPALAITAEEQERYVQKGCSRCPACGSTLIEGDSVEIDENRALQDVQCKLCSAEWQDIYTLTGMGLYGE
jgi:hypothetical protein